MRRRKTDRQTDRQRERQKERERGDKERERERESLKWIFRLRQLLCGQSRKGRL
jgi:hypothetical protein